MESAAEMEDVMKLKEAATVKPAFGEMAVNVRIHF